MPVKKLRLNKSLFFILFLISLSANKMQGQSYSIWTIADTLKNNANSVIRMYQKDISIHSSNKATVNVESAVTVLNRKGALDAALLIPFDNTTLVEKIAITIYDLAGNKLKKIPRSEIQDLPAYDGFTLVSDNRILYYLYKQAQYPYTVEAEYTISFNNFISYGLWLPYTNYNQSVEHSQLKIEIPKNLKYYKKEFKLLKPSQVVETNDALVETWVVTNLKAISPEDASPPFNEIQPSVYLMPEKIIYDKYSGSASSWTDFGLWINQLYNKRSELAANEKTELDLQLKQFENDLDKARFLYRYMQSKTRYVNISLGIGGYQPFDAITVSENGYGDCKALTNYMFALLKHANIQSFPALVAAGKTIEPIFKDFPNFHQFNHVILCLPNIDKDTIWLECTNQEIPFGFLGTFADNRQALLITSEGGIFAQTTKYELQENRKYQFIHYVIDSVGNAEATMQQNYSGLFYYYIFDILKTNETEKKRFVDNLIPLPFKTIKSFSFQENGGVVPSARMNLNFEVDKLLSHAGKYKVLKPNQLNSVKALSENQNPREHAFIIHRSQLEIDTVIIDLPDHFKINKIPQFDTLISDFGSYEYSLNFKGNRIIYSRKYEIYQGTYSPIRFKEYLKFINTLAKYDEIKLLLTQ